MAALLAIAGAVPSAIFDAHHARYGFHLREYYHGESYSKMDAAVLHLQPQFESVVIQPPFEGILAPFSTITALALLTDAPNRATFGPNLTHANYYNTHVTLEDTGGRPAACVDLEVTLALKSCVYIALGTKRVHISWLLNPPKD